MPEIENALIEFIWRYIAIFFAINTKITTEYLFFEMLLIVLSNF